MPIKRQYLEQGHVTPSVLKLLSVLQFNRQKAFLQHKVAPAYLPRALLQLFCDIEFTGHSMQFEQKFGKSLHTVDYRPAFYDVFTCTCWIHIEFIFTYSLILFVLLGHKAAIVTRLWNLSRSLACASPHKRPNNLTLVRPVAFKPPYHPLLKYINKLFQPQ